MFFPWGYTPYKPNRGKTPWRASHSLGIGHSTYIIAYDKGNKSKRKENNLMLNFYVVHGYGIAFHKKTSVG